MPTEPKLPASRNVILIGFMGCGKSTAGRGLAEALGFAFADTDEAIAREAGASIPEIFAEHGEEHFRDLESGVLEDYLGKSGHVIATGGGIVLRESNRSLLHQLGYVVWLDAPEDVIFERVSRNRERPLLHTENPRETVARLLAERRPVYEQSADLHVKTGDLNFDEITHGIADSARVYFSRETG